MLTKVDGYAHVDLKEVVGVSIEYAETINPNTCGGDRFKLEVKYKVMLHMRGGYSISIGTSGYFNQIALRRDQIIKEIETYNLEEVH